jgi:hypothetical protein
VGEEVPQGGGEDDHGRPDVEAEAEDRVGLVDPQRLDPQPAEYVRHAVQRERAPVAELELAVGPDHQRRYAEAPQRLVEERRVVRQLAGDRARAARFDLQCPRQVGRLAEQLLVEPVAEPPDALRDGEAGRHDVGDHAQGDPHAAARQPRAERTTGDAAPDTEAALPDLQRVDRVPVLAEVVLGGRDHVVDPGADDAERHGVDRDVHDRALGAAARLEPPLAEEDRGDHASDDAECVRPQRKRTEVPDRRARAGN